MGRIEVPVASTVTTAIGPGCFSNVDPAQCSRSEESGTQYYLDHRLHAAGPRPRAAPIRAFSTGSKAILYTNQKRVGAIRRPGEAP
ncbi:hypothetical protein BSZ21_21975 [Bradyrhizobium canariense]|uniref:hypothetical protein n=1 Tax=Bradyrhizobium canariense TaxID=255045 RepID=UPI000A19A468|nr:hypothetical protein [Bradyrhizobium canariense]OSI65051.1 hypothetical protein BSZ21_21975 [Bradyrhizobium canariense]